MLDVRKLRMLAELERLGTLAAVAESLHLTAPGISMQLATLEREVGVALTERRGRRLALTPAGATLAAHGRELLDRLSLAELELDALRRGASGSYRVTAFPSAARTLVADTWAALRSDGSGLELRVETAEPERAVAALLAGETDLAIVHSYSNVPRALPDGVDVDPIAEERVRIAIRSDDRAAAARIDLAALAEHPWVAPPSTLTCFDMVDRACGLAGFRPRVAGTSSDFAALLAFVAAGAGVALVPELTVATLPEGVVLANPATPVARATVALRRTALHGDAGLDRIVSALRDAAAVRLAARPA